MESAPLVWDLFFRGIAVGGLVAIGVAFLLSRAGAHMRAAALLFCLSTVAYAFNSSAALREALGQPGTGAVWLLSVAGAGFAWLFLVALFEDRRITPVTLTPVALLFVVGLIGWRGPDPMQPTVWVIHNLIEAALAVHALIFIWRSWRDDLVEARRRLRGPFLGAVAFYVIVLAGFEIAEAMGHDAAWHRLAGSASLALFCLAGCAALLTLRDNIFGAVAPAPASLAPTDEGGDAQDRIIAARLDEVMTRDALWMREGLTIGMLAEALGAPEHRVRRVINGHLGHRNFAAFVNIHRIGAAKTALAAPANATRTIAAIAFDLGYGSLGPFNRAFKEATGVTPTVFRQQALEAASPNS